MLTKYAEFTLFPSSSHVLLRDLIPSAGLSRSLYYSMLLSGLDYLFYRKVQPLAEPTAAMQLRIDTIPNPQEINAGKKRTVER